MNTAPGVIWFENKLREQVGPTKFDTTRRPSQASDKCDIRLSTIKVSGQKKTTINCRFTDSLKIGVSLLRSRTAVSSDISTRCISHSSGSSRRVRAVSDELSLFATLGVRPSAGLQRQRRLVQRRSCVKVDATTIPVDDRDPPAGQAALAAVPTQASPAQPSCLWPALPAPPRRLIEGSQTQHCCAPVSNRAQHSPAPSGNGSSLSSHHLKLIGFLH